MKRPFIRTGQVNKLLIIAASAFSLVYISWWFRFDNADNKVLYYLLFAGEIFHLLLAYLFFFNAWPRKKTVNPGVSGKKPSVDVFITVAGEPVEIVRNTVLACKRLNYPNFRIYILNDGKAAGKDDWTDIEKLAREEKVGHIARDTNKGFKAGNINNALSRTDGELVVIFDADMAPYPDFLEKTVFFFDDPQTGFVQTPQYYINYEKNEITRGAWEQQEFFFGPIMIGKDGTNSAFVCGTNVVLRRTALMDAGGMQEDNIAEDFVTSVFLHKKGWRSHYVSTVLAVGLAPEDPLSYYKQQMRWARGSLQVLIKHNPLFVRGLSLGQRLEYLASTLFYLSGSVVVIDAMMPLVFLYTKLQPVKVSTSDFAFYFFPFISLILLSMFVLSKGSLTFRALSFSFSSWELQLKALFSVLTGKKVAFAVTPKNAQTGNFGYLAYPHIGYIVLFIAGAIYAIFRDGINPGVMTNIAWASFNAILFIPFISAVYSRQK